MFVEHFPLTAFLIFFLLITHFILLLFQGFSPAHAITNESKNKQKISLIKDAMTTTTAIVCEFNSLDIIQNLKNFILRNFCHNYAHKKIYKLI